MQERGGGGATVGCVVDEDLGEVLGLEAVGAG